MDDLFLVENVLVDGDWDVVWLWHWDLDLLDDFNGVGFFHLNWHVLFNGVWDGLLDDLGHNLVDGHQDLVFNRHMDWMWLGDWDLQVGWHMDWVWFWNVDTVTSMATSVATVISTMTAIIVTAVTASAGENNAGKKNDAFL